MSVTPELWNFSIGGVELTKFEVPSELVVGHDMKIAKHYFLNEQGVGNIKTHFQGAFPTPTEWKGTLLYENALPRSQQLASLFVNGSPITWIYGPLKFTVVVESFHCTFKSYIEIDYDLKLVVVQDANGIASPSPAVTLDVNTQQFFDYGNQAYGTLSAADVALPASITAPYGLTTASLQAAYPLRNASIQTLLSISSLVGTLVTGLQAYATALQNTAILQADLARLSACLQALQGFGLLNENLQQFIGTSQTNTIIVATNISLFQLAAQYYPQIDVVDAAQAMYTANGLTDFIVTGGTTVSLPQVF